MFLLDTNILSELIRAKPNTAVLRKLLGHERRLRFASEMSRYELRFGAALHPEHSRLWTRIETHVLPRFTWLPIDTAVIDRSADLGAALRLSGQVIEWADIVIAATALVHDQIVVTRNVRHFERVPDLRVENWFPNEQTPAQA